MLDAIVNILRGSAPEFAHRFMFLDELSYGAGYCAFLDIDDLGYGWAFYDDNVRHGEGRGTPRIANEFK